MKTRFSLFLIAILSCRLLAAQVHISISDPESWSAQELAPYIGQTVIFDVPMVVTSNVGNSLTIAPRRLFTPTNQAYPNSPAYQSIVRLNGTGAMTLDGVSMGSPIHRCGEKIYHLQAKVNSTGSLTWVSGEWRGNTRAELEAGLPDIGDYRLLVCTFNLEYFLSVDFDASSSMGPDNAAQHAKQCIKINKALKLINADVYGFVEIQQGDSALKEIADSLNSLIPARNYAYISDGSVPNGTYTKSGFLYDANKIEPLGQLQENNTKVQNRKKMICFREIATGERFIFSVNHFKAKSGNGSGSDANQNDGQGGYNATRVAEAQSVMEQYKRYRPAIREKDILIMGDLNAYAKEDPITCFTSNGMIDLHRAFHADSSYSYQFAGLAGYLDHAICNSTLFPQVTGVAGFHINSDESDNYTYDKSNDLSMFRCSDHDPVLVGLKLDSTLVYDPSPTLNSLNVLSGEDKTLTIFNAVKEGQQSYYAIYSINGVLLERNEITDTQQQVDLPHSAGLYIVYIYFDGIVYQRKLLVR